MSDRGSIRQTLYKNLFTRITPSAKGLYKEARPLLFPGESEFERFLKTSNHQIMVESSKKILLRLIYSNNLQPSSRLLFNLLYSQEVMRAEKGEYIPQDHFVHLVNLYLLGIYIFSYHRSLHTKCVSEINKAKRASITDCKLSSIDIPVRNVYETFGLMWSQFVLYHDLCYPLEKTSMLEKTETQKYRSILVPFEKLTKANLTDVSLKVLARLLVARSIINDESEETLADFYLDHLPSDLEEDKSLALESWKEADYLSRVTGPEDLRLILTFFSKYELCAVVEDKNNGDPVLIIIGDVLLNIKKGLSKSIIKTYSSFSAMTSKRRPFDGERYVCRFFARNIKKEFEKKVECIFEKDKENFEEMCNHFESDDSFTTIKMTLENASSDLGFVVFHKLCEIKGYISEHHSGESLEESFEIFKKSFKTVGQRIPGIISRCVRESLKQDVSERILDPVSILQGMNDSDAAREFIRHLTGGKKNDDLTVRVKDAIEPEIRKSFDLERNVKKCLTTIREKLEDQKNDELKLNPFSGEDLGALSLAKLIEKLPYDWNEVDSFLQKNYLKSFSFLVNNYQPDWATSKNFVDHGFAATFLILNTCKTIEHLRNTDEEKTQLLKISMDINEDTDFNLYKVQTSLLKRIVLPAVLLHNIYPSSLLPPRNNYKTQLTKQPFVYLALLADALQRWDRERIAIQASGDIKNILPGSNYDIRIEGDLIHIYLNAPKIDMKEEESKQRVMFDEYLKDAKAIIRLTFSERPW